MGRAFVTRVYINLNIHISIKVTDEIMVSGCNEGVEKTFFSD